MKKLKTFLVLLALVCTLLFTMGMARTVSLALSGRQPGNTARGIVLDSPQIEFVNNILMCQLPLKIDIDLTGGLGGCSNEEIKKQYTFSVMLNLRYNTETKDVQYWIDKKEFQISL